jgi:hypothetical protein
VRGEIVARSSKFVAVLRTAGGGIDAVQQKNYPRTYPKKLGCHRKVSQILDHSALSFRSDSSVASVGRKAPVAGVTLNSRATAYCGTFECRFMAGCCLRRITYPLRCWTAVVRFAKLARLHGRKTSQRNVRRWTNRRYEWDRMRRCSPKRPMKMFRRMA